MVQKPRRRGRVRRVRDERAEGRHARRRSVPQARLQAGTEPAQRTLPIGKGGPRAAHGLARLHAPRPLARATVAPPAALTHDKKTPACILRIPSALRQSSGRGRAREVRDDAGQGVRRAGRAAHAFKPWIIWMRQLLPTNPFTSASRYGPGRALYSMVLPAGSSGRKQCGSNVSADCATVGTPPIQQPSPAAAQAKAKSRRFVIFCVPPEHVWIAKPRMARHGH